MAKSEKRGNWLVSLECPVCGKPYVPAPFHSYKAIINYRQQKVCSYTCMMKAVRQRESEHQERLKATAEKRRAAKSAKTVEI